MMRDATNAVLDGMRARDKSIQTLNDVAAYLILHPAADDLALRLYMNSGYLTVWRVQRGQSPWQYNGSLMSKISGADDQLKDYCLVTLAGEKIELNRYRINRKAYNELARETGYRTFKALARLYWILDGLHQRRVVVATQWLASKGLLPSE
jgi:hypothetical protein